MSDEKSLPLEFEAKIRFPDKEKYPDTKALAYAEVVINGGVSVEGYKVFENSKTGKPFVSPPSRPTEGGGHRETVKTITAESRANLHNAVLNAYDRAVEKLQQQAASFKRTGEPPAREGSIAQQLEKGGAKAAAENAARPMPEKQAKSAERG